jgi:tetratricopeptide (TPR) repeat protein
MNIPSVIRLIGAVCFLTIVPVTGHALTPAQVFDKVKDSIVVVETLDAQDKVKGQGSGVILSSGRVATNCHVVEGGASYLAGRGEELISATLYAEDGDKDICLLDAKGIQGKPAQLGKAAGLKVGDPVYAVGAPQGLELSLSDGIVAQLRGRPAPMIQTTAAISPGSSGGGLFDGEGRLVGLTTFYLEGGQSLNFAMPAEWIGEIKPGRKLVAEGLSDAEWLRRGAALEMAEDWQGLLDLGLKWTKSEPKNAFAWVTLGNSYDHLNCYDDALEGFRQAVRIDPENGFAWTGLGDTYTHLNRYAAAVEAYRQAIRINPENAAVWNNLGTAYIYLDRSNDAVEAYRQAIKISPGCAEAWYDLGVAYGYLNRYNDSIKAFREAIRIDPKNVAAWNNLAIDYDLSGDRKAALGVVRELQRLDPAQADVLFNLIVPP